MKLIVETDKHIRGLSTLKLISSWFLKSTIVLFYTERLVYFVEF